MTQPRVRTRMGATSAAALSRHTPHASRLRLTPHAPLRLIRRHSSSQNMKTGKLHPEAEQLKTAA